MTDFNTAKQWLIKLLQFPTVEQTAIENMPFGKPLYDCLKYSLSLLEQNGFTTKNLEGYCGYGEIGQGELFGILCHLDVVPVGDNWTYPPFSATEANNRIYARGALDDKSPFIGCLYAIIRLLEEGYHPTKRIRFILGCDEESGWTCMDRYTKTEEMPVMGISPDGDFPVINCEKGIVYHKIIVPLPKGIIKLSGGERANMVPDSAVCLLENSKETIEYLNKINYPYEVENGAIKVVTKGKSAHGSHPENGDNAIIKMLKILSFLPQMEVMYEAFYLSDGRGVNLNLSDSQSGNLTLNLGTVQTNNNELTFELDIRHPITFTKDEITAIIQKALPFTVIQGFFHLPLYVDKDHFLVKTLLEAYNSVMKTNLKPLTIGGGTYARVLPLGVAFGPSFPDSEASIHCVDEYIDLTEWKNSIEIYYTALKNLCFEK